MLLSPEAREKVARLTPTWFWRARPLRRHIPAWTWDTRTRHWSAGSIRCTTSTSSCHRSRNKDALLALYYQIDCSNWVYTIKLIAATGSILSNWLQQLALYYQIDCSKSVGSSAMRGLGGRFVWQSKLWLRHIIDRSMDEEDGCYKTAYARTSHGRRAGILIIISEGLEYW